MEQFELSPDQKSAINDLQDWYHNYRDSGFINVGGLAGTGKSFLITYFRQKLPKNISVAFCAYTGKATSVLRKKLKDHKFKFPNDSISTIHSLMYRPIVDENGEITGWDKNGTMDCDLIIVDEASMLTRFIFNDLMSYGVPIIAVGDHGQLPPIGDDFNLMEDPLIKLETPHRFIENNPLIQLSIQARKSGKIPMKQFSENIKKCRICDMTDADEKTFVKTQDMLTNKNVILCGYNSTRIKVNTKLRTHFGFKGKGLGVGERVICLRNNNKANVPIFNGVQGTVKYAKHFSAYKYFNTTIAIDGEENYYRGKITSTTFNVEKPTSKEFSSNYDNFDFGYCMTTWKAQGSSWPNVMVFEERFPGMNDEDWIRWIYTAITRAENKLLIIGK